MAIKASYSIIITSIILLVFGIAQSITSFVIVSKSQGQLTGGWYVGISSIVCAIRGLKLTNRLTFQYITYISAFSMLIAIIGSALQGVEYNFYNSLDACAEVTDAGTGNCNTQGIGANFECYGNSNAFGAAAACEYFDSSYQCSCVESSSCNANDDDNACCYLFNDYSSCSVIINDLPGLLHSSYSLAMVCLFASLAMFILSLTIITKPKYFDEDDLNNLPIAQVQTINPPGINTNDVYVLQSTDNVTIQPNGTSISVPIHQNTTNPIIKGTVVN
mmetsp:Transcript_17905/g.16174  ORF Transcript_17905/g.16174 Transcript_17905/m.16174 type:complete len:275 (+) Transcript_17905:33-857(+)